jgi:DNA/RNA-binding domain of Phe-tRNA-synthetase-like protein
LPLAIEDSLQKSFLGLQVVELKMMGLKISEKNDELQAFKTQAQQKVRQSYQSPEQIRDQPIFRSYRDFFWRVGIDPTKTRPAGEALTRRIVGGKELPTINTLVDSYNIASVMSSVAIAAFDLDAVSESDLFMRKARGGESFLGIGMNSEMNLKGVEVVIEDVKSHRVIAIYPYRDSDDSRVTLQTTNVLLMMCGVPGILIESLNEASKLSKEFVERFCSK